MTEITNFCDTLCNLCILLMSYLSKTSGFSYGFINIMLFVIFGPLATLLFMTSTVISMTMDNRRLRRVIVWTLFTVGLLIVIGIAFIVINTILAAPVSFY